MNEITQLISSVGFPIVAYFCMLMMYKTESEKHAEETKELTTAINSLKEAIIEMRSKEE